jgi:hypothetical protein
MKSINIHLEINFISDLYMDYYEKHGQKIYEELSNVNQSKESDIEVWARDLQKKRGIVKEDKILCEYCDTEKIHDPKNNKRVCPECGLTDYTLTFTDYQAKKGYYKAMTHFKDWITKTQAKHAPTINPNVYKLIKLKYPNNQDITYKTIKLLLKKNKLFNYYEDIWYILNYLRPDVPILNLTTEEENILYNYFSKIAFVWHKVKPDNRKSIISYPFIIVKLLRMINRCDLIKYFILPKYEKIIQYETIWTKIYPYL